MNYVANLSNVVKRPDSGKQLELLRRHFTRGATFNTLYRIGRTPVTWRGVHIEHEQFYKLEQAFTLIFY